MLLEALKVFEEAQENPDLAFEFAEVAGHIGSGIVETIFIYAFLKGLERGLEKGKEVGKDALHT